MTSPLHQVDHESCKGDGICVEICPECVLEIADGIAATVESRAGHCIMCGQCVAICPTESLQMPDLPMEDFQDLTRLPFDYAEFLKFLNVRRSVRVFKDRPVEQELLDKILKAAATAPMGFPPHTTEVVAVSKREERDFLLEQLVKEYDAIAKAFSNPIGRTVTRLSVGGEVYHALKTKIVHVAETANQAYRKDGSDRYMYHAPLILIFHISRWALSYQENAHLVCHHAMLAALSLGLGTTIIGMVPSVVERSKVLRERYGIPKDNKVITSLIVGYPKYRYKKSIRRGLASVRIV